MIHYIVLFVAGIVVGVMNAIAGGGMLLGFPILLAYGLPAIVANATANIVVLPGNIGAAIGYRKYLKRVPPKYLLLIIPAIVGASIGAIALRHTSFKAFEHYIPGLITVAVILFAFQPYLYKKMHDHAHSFMHSNLTLYYFGLAVLVLSVYGGYFGAGFGFVMLAFLGFTKLHNHVHRMNALKSIITVCIALTSIACLYSAHLIKWQTGLVMGSGNLIGGYGGAIGVQKVSSNILRVIIIIIGLSTAIYLVFRSY